jgi:predicted RecA/RadA family phage recombinase
MAQATFVQDGRSIDHTPVSAVVAGQVVVQGPLVGIAKGAIAAGALGALAVEGVFDIVQAAVTFAVGQAVYWDADGDPVGGTQGTGAAVESATGNTFMGFALAATLATDETVRVALRSVESSAAETLSLGDLGDVGAVAYDAGRILVADGDSYEDRALTGPLTLSGAGVIGVASATVAAAGSDQTDAAAIAEGFTLVTAANATKGVKLPAAAAGKVCIVKNSDAANAVLKVYPDTDDAINALAANAALAMAAKTSALLVAYDATTWYTVPLLPS